MFKEELRDATFHSRVARIHGEGNELAQRFNDRVEKIFPDHPEFKLRYSECWIYKVHDPRSNVGHDGIAWILAEPQLEGQWTKWNNNAGKVAKENPNGPSGLCWHVPQAFSHFTYVVLSLLFCRLWIAYNRTHS